MTNSSCKIYTEMEVTKIILGEAGGYVEMKKIHFKRIMALMLSFVMIMGAAFAMTSNTAKAASEATFTVTADKTELHRGDQFTVSVSMADNVNAYGLTYKMFYDAKKVSLVGEPAKGSIIDEAPNCGGYGIYNKITGSDGIQATVICLSKAVPNGTLMSATFEVLEDAEVGDLNFTYDIMITDESTAVLEHTNNDQTDLSVVVPVTGISLNKNETTIARGATEQLTATVVPEGTGSTVAWSSDNEEVATVDQNGLVTAVGKGTANITATAGGQSASCKVTVNAPLQGIQITGEQSTIKKGQTTQLSVIYEPEDTTDDATVTWSSDNEDVATVDQTGLVKAVADGTANIKAKVGTLEATYAITVQEVKLNSIAIKDATTIHRGGTETLEVTYDPENTTDDKTVVWESSDPTVANVDGSGTVTAVGIGSAKITAKVGNHTDVCVVTVDAPLESIDVQDALELVKNQTAVINYELVPSDTTDKALVTFTSSDPTVATVDENGKVTALKAGTTVITLKGANDVTAEVTVTVTEIQIDTVSLDKESAVVEKGQTTELTAVVGPETTTDENKSIKWSSSDPSVVKVSPEQTNSGEKVTVTATDKGGTATITAEAWNGTKAECVITVPIHIENVTLPQDVTLNRGRTTVLDVVCDPEENDDTITSVEWQSDAPEVAFVYSDGTIEGIKEGTANVTAKVTVTTLANETKEYTAQTQVTVNENHLDADLGEKLAFEKMEDALLKGQSIDMYAQLNLEDIMYENEITDGVLIEWTSSDEDVATIGQTGRLTGLKKGSTTITAVVTAKDGEGQIVGTYTVETEVEVKEIPLESIAFDKIIKEMVVGSSETLHIIYNPENTTDLRDVEWSSSDEAILSVENGKVTALKPGTATITAKVGDKEVSCEILVKAAESGQPGQGSGTDSGNAAGAGTDKGDSVRTGDTANIILYIVLLAGAMAAIVIIWRKRRFTK